MEATEGKPVRFSEEDVGAVIYMEDGYEKNRTYN